MTLRELTQLGDIHSQWVYLFFAAMPLLALVLGFFSKQKKEEGTLKYIYSCLVYGAVIPGMGAAVLIGYALFFTNENLLDVSVGLYFAPILAMIMTLVFVSKAVNFSDLPGFHRLSGLIVLVSVSFCLVLAIKKMFIGIFFGGGIAALAVIGVVIFILLKWAMYTAFKGKNEPKKFRPSLFK